MARSEGWIAEPIEGFPDNDSVASNLKSKYLKARPHSNSILSMYRYTVYQDTKIIVSEAHVLASLRNLPPNKFIGMCKHRFFVSPTSVWREYDEGRHFFSFLFYQNLYYFIFISYSLYLLF